MKFGKSIASSLWSAVLVTMPVQQASAFEKQWRPAAAYPPVMMPKATTPIARVSNQGFRPSIAQPALRQQRPVYAYRAMPRYNRQAVNYRPMRQPRMIAQPRRAVAATQPRAVAAVPTFTRQYGWRPARVATQINNRSVVRDSRVNAMRSPSQQRPVQKMAQVQWRPVAVSRQPVRQMGPVYANRVMPSRAVQQAAYRQYRPQAQPVRSYEQSRAGWRPAAHAQPSVSLPNSRYRVNPQASYVPQDGFRPSGYGYRSVQRDSMAAAGPSQLKRQMTYASRANPWNRNNRDFLAASSCTWCYGG